MSSYSDRLNACESGHVKRKRKQIKDAANEEVIKKTKSILSFIPKAIISHDTNSSKEDSSDDIEHTDKAEEGGDISSISEVEDQNVGSIREVEDQDVGSISEVEDTSSISDVEDQDDAELGVETDIGLLPDNPSDTQVQSYAKIGPQHLPSYMEPDNENRQFPTAVTKMKLPNGEFVDRDWLAFSATKYAVYCFPCRIFYSELTKTVKTPSHLCKSDGWNKEVGWHNLRTRVKEHENSVNHKKSYLDWKQLEARSKNAANIDNLLSDQLKSEVRTWRMLLQRIIDVVLTLAERGLAFRGSNHRIGDMHNGNFLGIIELLSRYDPILQDHVEKVREAQQSGKRLQAHYLSPETQNEFINLCSDQVRDKILQERITAKYYSIIVDATPDVSHYEQNTFILRYLTFDGSKYAVQERFLDFLKDNAKSGEDITEMILKELDHHNIPLVDSRGQAYDNASNMSGKFKGVQKRLKDLNPLCTYSPCGNHSLNLIGIDAVKSSVEFITFFGTVQTVYTLFSSSPRRWDLLQESIGCSLHGMSGNLK